MKLPTLTQESQSQACTRWIAKFPSTIRKDGATYHVTTYPNSDIVFIETAVNRRVVRGSRIEAAIRAALETRCA